MAKDRSEALLDSFAASTDPDERVRALSELMTIKAIPKRADDARFGTGLDRWVELANHSDAAPRDRLLAIAELIRATQQLRKQRQPELIKKIQPAFQSMLPPLALLEDAEARLNVARACSAVDAPWLQAYRAVTIANETALKPRAEMMEGIVTRAASIADVLDLLMPAFAGIQPETENPADSLAKRLTRTLEVFRTTVLASLLEAGPDVGKRLDAFIRSTLTSTGRPKDEDVQVDLTREVALTLHDLVRSRFSLATEPQTFQALQYCRAFFQGISWPKEVQRETGLLVQDVSEALVMLGRMGVPNQDLLNRLELTCGIKERARAVAAQIADKHTEIDESIRAWLRTGRKVNTIAASDVLQESLLTTVDEALGLALVEARTFKASSEAEQRLTSSLEIFDPALVGLFKGIVTQSLAMHTAIEDLAKRRGLELVGGIGDEIEFSPKYFDALGALHGTRATVRRPAIVRSSSHGAVGTVVKKGLVE
jgi:hypothetical protein